jgi:FMN phosphatase YigB (HAD superfamily)
MTRTPIIRLLVLDLDNTLYDWVGFFVPSFYRMVEVASELLNVEREQLLSDLQVVHQKYRNSEQPFALLETNSVAIAYPNKTRAELAATLDTAFHAFNKTRKELLKLFPGVKETLEKIKLTGCPIVAHTEAVVSNSLFRLDALSLRQEISRLYAPDSKGLGHPTGKEPYTKLAGGDFLRLLPSDHRKPDPTVLRDIMADYGVSAMETLYVGDSITRDITMAKHAGTHAAWAKYGTRYDRNLWDKLVRVTHWTPEDVAREVELRKESESIRPDSELDDFAALCRFYRFSGTNILSTELSPG